MKKNKAPKSNARKSEFKIYSEYKIPLDKERYIHDDIIGNYIESLPSEVRDGYGIYVFYRRAGNHRVPFYVGKANGRSGFEGEIFHATKLKKYNDTLINPKGLDYTTNGHYYFLFYVLQRKIIANGKKLASLKDYQKNAITALEKQLINEGFNKNPFIKNIQHTINDVPLWQINDITGTGRDGKHAKTHKSIFEV